MDAMGQTREPDAKIFTLIINSIQNRLEAAVTRCEDMECRLANLRRAFRFAVIVGAIGWLFTWALAASGWVQ